MSNIRTSPQDLCKTFLMISVTAKTSFASVASLESQSMDASSLIFRSAIFVRHQWIQGGHGAWI